jgi:hypothetical protein
MRDDVSEVKVHHTSRELQHSSRLHGSQAGDKLAPAILAPVAVDEAFADESSACFAEPSETRRQMDASSNLRAPNRVVDRPHEKIERTDSQSSDSGDILRELADRMAELQRQHLQIQQLLANAQRS